MKKSNFKIFYFLSCFLLLGLLNSCENKKHKQETVKKLQDAGYSKKDAETMYEDYSGSEHY